MNTIQRLAGYRRALAVEYPKAIEEWKARGGENGRGGKWDRKAQCYTIASKPEPPEFGPADAFTLKLAAKIKAEVMP